MGKQDRLYVEKSEINKTRNLLNKDNTHHLKFDSNKESFLYAMVLGKNHRKKLERKDGLFLDKDLNILNKTIIYANIYKHLDNLDDLTNNNKVYSIAEEMANTGYKILDSEGKNMNKENLELLLIQQLEEKYSELVNKGLL